MGWDALANGDLIAAAEAAGFDALVTADRNIRYQQNLAERRIALAVLGTNRWSAIEAQAHRVADALSAIGPGGYAEIAFDRPPLARRPFPRADG
jgi:hypothetical protein